MGLFLGFAEEEEKLPDFNPELEKKTDKKPEGNIIALNSLEHELLLRKEKIRALDEPDETLSVLARQLETEISNMKKGKADSEALERGKEMLSMLDSRLAEKNHPLKELQRKMKKEGFVSEKTESGDEDSFKLPEPDPEPVSVGSEEKAEEKPDTDNIDFGLSEPIEEGVEMEEQSFAKEEEKIKKNMEEKLENAKEPVEEKSASKSEPEPEKKTGGEGVVEEGYFEPGADEKKETEERPEPKPEPAPTLKAGLGKTTGVDPLRAKELLQSSIDVLLDAQLESGAIIPVASQKSYIHVYPRDHGFAILALLHAGKDEEAKKALEFALLHQDKKNGNFPQRWDEAGNNTSHKNPQPDATALVLYAFAKYVLQKNNIAFAEKNWGKIEKGIDFLVDSMVSDKNLVYTKSSVHEFPPEEEGYEIWTNAVCTAAFRELSKVSEKIRVEYEPLKKENLLKDSLVEYMWNSRTKSFAKSIRVKESSSVSIGPDASALALSFFDVFPVSESRLKTTVELIDEKLWHKSYGGISKYVRVDGRELGGFGASPLFTLFLADYYTKAGDKEKAGKYINWAVSMSFNGLLPERFSTKEDFEGYVSDASDAGLLNREVMKMINATRAHEDFKNGVAHISEPFTMAHAAFIIAWKNYQEKFL